MNRQADFEKAFVPAVTMGELDGEMGGLENVVMDLENFPGPISPADFDATQTYENGGDVGTLTALNHLNGTRYST